MNHNIFFRWAVAAVVLGSAACAGTDEAEPAVADQTAVAAVEAPAAGADAAVPATAGTVHEVRMMTTQGGAAGVFEPAKLTVKQGDVVRFVMADAQSAHNVYFDPSQNPAGAALPAPSPYLTQAGESWEMTADMAAGSYDYICQPHAAMGMTGQITVQ